MTTIISLSGSLRRAGQALPDFGMNRSATPLLHQRWPVGGGPSSNTCP
jgi:hypothetical protein